MSPDSNHDEKIANQSSLQKDEEGSDLLKPTDGLDKHELNHEGEIQALNPELVENLPDETRAIIRELTVHRGPLPHPSILKDYNEIVPDSAAKIIEAFLKQNDHSIDMEQRQMVVFEKVTIRGQVFGFTMGFVGMIASFVLAYFGKDEISWGAFITSLVIIGANIFDAIYEKFFKNRNNKENNKSKEEEEEDN